jgi:N-acetylmuramic acid 6-phosphate etherase
MLEHLTTEARNPASERLDSLSALEIVRLMNAEDARVPAAVAAQEEPIAAAIEVIAERLRGGGRLIYFGAGTSGRLGVLDATECPPTFNSPPEQVVGLIAGGTGALTRAIEGAEDKPELGEADLRGVNLSAADVVVGIATSGRTPYVIGGLKYARQLGAYAIALVCNEASAVSAAADLTIAPIVGPEVLSGSTRLKAGTATKLVLNMFSTGAMVRIGKTFGNLMVDLRATNSKLRDRTQRIVSHLTGLEPEQAAELLSRCEGELKTAVVMHRRQVSAEEARRRLTEAKGHLRTALEYDQAAATGREYKLDAPASADATPNALAGASSLSTVRSKELQLPGGARGTEVPHYERGVQQQRPLTTHHSPLTPLLLGIDGGGTGTDVLLATLDESGNPRILGRGQAGPSNPRAIGFPACFAALEQAITGAFCGARLAPCQVDAACLALAGAGRESERLELERWAISRSLAKHFQQVNDAEPVLAAGSREGWGIALIAGTGSLAYGKNRSGEMARAGGWGYLFGDEGSAYSIALAALRAVAAAIDGRGPQTALQSALMQALQIESPAELIAKVYGDESMDRRAIAALAPVVTEVAASTHDGAANAVIDQATDELARAVQAVAVRLGVAHEPFPLALAGGVLVNSSLVCERLLSRLSGSQLAVSQVMLVDQPAMGTVRIAARLIVQRS